MRFWEAVKAMSEGKKVRVKTWPDNEFIYMGEESVLQEDNEELECVDSYMGKTNIDKEWEEYTETHEKWHKCEKPLGSDHSLEWCKQEKDGLKIYVTDGWDSLLAKVDFCPFCGFTLKGKV